MRLAGAAGALRATWEHPLPPVEHAVLQRWLGPARDALGERRALA